MLNLAVNARDAIADGGALTFETALEILDGASATRGLAPGGYVVLSVTDTGVGIQADHVERIFEPFFTMKDEGKGSGLGLATVYGIVKGHGGTVRVYSELGVGSRFMVYLPAHEGGAVPQTAPTDDAPRGSGVVMVVDDEKIVRRTAGRMLAALGYEPVLVPGGPEALEWLSADRDRIAAVVLDLAMPGMDGRACFRMMRKARPELVVLVSSGFTRNGRAEELLAEGAAGFVQKPYRNVPGKPDHVRRG